MYDFLDAMITQQTSPEEVCTTLVLSFFIGYLTHPSTAKYEAGRGVGISLHFPPPPSQK